MLLNNSEEGELNGLGLIDGVVKKFVIGNLKKLPLPHMGWNTVEIVENPLFKGIPQKALFYFVHSYHYVCDKKYTLAEDWIYNNILSND